MNTVSLQYDVGGGRGGRRQGRDDWLVEQCGEAMVAPPRDQAAQPWTHAQVSTVGLGRGAVEMGSGYGRNWKMVWVVEGHRAHENGRIERD